MNKSIDMTKQTQQLYFDFQKFKFRENQLKKVDFRKFLDPIWEFSTKKGFKIRDSPNFVIPFGTKNHEMWGPPVYPTGNI